MQLRAAEGANSKKKKRADKTSGSDVFRIVKLIMEREYDPVIVFSFNRRDCEAYAMMMTKLEFTTDEEKDLIAKMFKNLMPWIHCQTKTDDCHKWMPSYLC